MADAKQALKAKVVKKKWLPIQASKFFDNAFLGECYAPAPELLIGRTVAANLANLTGDIRQQSVTLRFVVMSVENDTGIADVVGCEMAPSAIRRIVRRGSDRIDESFVCETSTGQKVIIKPMLITKTATKSAVHGSLRKALISGVAKYVKKHSFESLINEIITAKLQTTLKAELKKTYPLKAVEVRMLNLIRGEGKENEIKGEAAGKEDSLPAPQETAEEEQASADALQGPELAPQA
ncbi:hypothetical protein HYU17_01890 [Candidatus Woesearchaeota archaeon]|nr:hypothetical protein [Candidatus Woesearchaeota archaeon]